MPTPLPLGDLHTRAKAAMRPWQGWIVPAHYGDAEEEYAALRRRAGLIDVSTKGVIQVTGADRVAFLHQLLTNDIKRLTPGTGCPAALLSPTAKVLADLIVLADEDSLWLLCERARIGTVLQQLERALFTEAVTLADQSDTLVVFALQGPSSLPALEATGGRAAALAGPFDHRQVTVRQIATRVVRESLTGDPGVLLIAPRDRGDSLWHTLLEAGASHGVRPVGWDALDTARIEAGRPWYGPDLDEGALLPETGLERQLASGTKGCYPGQEIVARMETYGSASRKLLGLVLEGTEVPAAGAVVLQAETAIGQVTSACYSPQLRKPIALAYIKRPHYEPGTAVQIRTAGSESAGTVVGLPFVATG